VGRVIVLTVHEKEAVIENRKKLTEKTARTEALDKGQKGKRGWGWGRLEETEKEVPGKKKDTECQST